MSEGDKAFTGSIPENYDRYMVPLIFESYAADITQRAAAVVERHVDVAQRRLAIEPLGMLALPFGRFSERDLGH